MYAHKFVLHLKVVKGETEKGLDIFFTCARKSLINRVLWLIEWTGKWCLLMIQIIL